MVYKFIGIFLLDKVSFNFNTEIIKINSLIRKIIEEKLWA